MKCRYCGYEIGDEELYCGRCGREAMVVPDYNPLEDILEAHVKVGVNDEEGYGSGHAELRQTSARRNTGGRGERMRQTSARRNTGERISHTSAGRGRGTESMRNTSARRNTVDRNASERERQRRKAARKKEMLRKRRRRALLVLGAFVAAAIAACFLLYQNSYDGLTAKGNKALAGQEYEEAASYFNRAISRDGASPEAYTGLSQVYVARGEIDEAEEVFLAAIGKQPDNEKIYEACIRFYIDTEQTPLIPELLEDAKDSVKEALAEYIIGEPEFSLDEEDTFDDVQQLTLTASAEEIYYTLDGSEPTLASTKYTESIQLNHEGETVVKAIAVDEQKIPSKTAERTYTIEFPSVDAPAVAPSTGQYEQAVQIEVKVPEGYAAYYTMNGEDPTTDSSKYQGPIEMPEGETLFKAILVSSAGRISGVTTRNYLLESE